MRPRVLVPLGPGFEELEAIAAVDILRRAGCHVVTASVGKNPIVGRNKVRVLADVDIDDALTEWGDDWSLVLLPGGLGGVDAMEKNRGLMDLLRKRVAAGQLTAAICAAPRLLVKAGLDTRMPVTNHPGCQSDLKDYPEYREADVVVAGSFITSRGAGTAVEFALACAMTLCGPDVADRVREEIVG